MWIVSRVIPVLKLYIIGFTLSAVEQNFRFTRFVMSCRNRYWSRGYNTSALHERFLANQNGRVAIVTGGARGLGYETVRQLVNLGMFVIIASRNKEEALCAVKKICEENSEAQGGCVRKIVCARQRLLNIVEQKFKVRRFEDISQHASCGSGERKLLCEVDFEFLDVASLQSVRDFVRRFKDRGLPLHVLINNAGVMLVPEGRTLDGFETHFATNYLGHFLLTRLLLKTLVHSGKDESYSRIINISSSAHYAADLRLHDLQSVQYYSAHAAYSQSKLAQVLFTYHVCSELESSGAPVTVNAVDPGVVNTGLYSHLSCLTRYAHKPIAHFLFKTPADGAATVVYSSVSSHLERVSGCYLYEGECVESSSNSYDEDLQTGLWQNTCDLLNLNSSLDL